MREPVRRAAAGRRDHQGAGRGSRCLLLDEPTAALERGAVQRLFDRVRQLRAAGVAILYISHHLEEVFEICTDVAVLRDGELVLAAPLAEVTKDDMVAAMVGEVKKDHYPERPGAAPAPESRRRGRRRRRSRRTWASAASA